MSKSYKLKDGNYIDSSSVAHDKTKLSDILNGLTKPVKTIVNSQYNVFTRKCGNVAQLTIQFTNSSSPLKNLGGYSSLALGTVPDDCKPSEEVFAPVYIRSSSGGTNVVYFAINSSGNVRIFNWGLALTNVETICATLTYIVS